MSRAHPQVSVSLVAGLLVFLVLPGCLPRALGTGEDLLPPERPLSGRDVTDLPRLTQSARSSRGYVAGLRTAIVDGRRSGAPWIRVAADGGLIVTGYLDGPGNVLAVREKDGSRGLRYVAGLNVPDDVGGLTIVHSIPIVFDPTMRITVGGERRRYADLIPKGEPTRDLSRWVTVSLAVQDGWIEARSLAFSSREVTWGAWPDGHRPDAAWHHSQLARDAARAPGAGESWLEVRPGRRFVVEGYAGGTVEASSDTTRGPTGSVDLTIPDRLGPAAVYHVVAVFYDRWRDAPKAVRESSSATAITRIPVRLAGGRLTGEKIGGTAKPWRPSRTTLALGSVALLGGAVIAAWALRRRKRHERDPRSLPAHAPPLRAPSVFEDEVARADLDPRAHAVGLLVFAVAVLGAFASFGVAAHATVWLVWASPSVRPYLMAVQPAMLAIMLPISLWLPALTLPRALHRDRRWALPILGAAWAGWVWLGATGLLRFIGVWWLLPTLLLIDFPITLAIVGLPAVAGILAFAAAAGALGARRWMRQARAMHPATMDVAATGG